MQTRIISFVCQAIVAATAVVWSGVSLGATPDPRPGASTPVQVVNQATNPVPVTGTLGVNGTVPVHDAGQPEPVEGQCIAAPAGGATATCNMFTVPAGKRLVVELISYVSNSSPTDGKPVDIIFGNSATLDFEGSSGRYFLPPVFNGALGNLERFADTRQARVYLDQNQALGVRIHFDQNNHVGSYFMFSGFLVNR